MRQLFGLFIVFNYLTGLGCVQPFLDEFLRAVLVQPFLQSVQAVKSVELSLQKTHTRKESKRVIGRERRTRRINRRVF